MKFLAMKSGFVWPARPSSMFAPIEVAHMCRREAARSIRFSFFVIPLLMSDLID
jgi:hypothetical protein